MAWLGRAHGDEEHLLRDLLYSDIRLTAGAYIQITAAAAQQSEAFRHRHVVGDLNHHVGAAPVGVIAHPLATLFFIGDFFEIEHGVRAHALGDF